MPEMPSPFSRSSQCVTGGVLEMPCLFSLRGTFFFSQKVPSRFLLMFHWPLLGQSLARGKAIAR